MKLDEKYTKYADDVLAGRIVACDYIKLAARRYLSFLDREDMYFNSDKVDKVISFVSKLKHFVGKHNGKSFQLLEWQKFIVYNLYGFYYKSNNKRVCKKCYIEVARKNGKSAFISALGLYSLIADGEAGAEVDVAANSRQQGKILFDMASNFITGLDSKGRYFKPYRDKIKFDRTKSVMQVFAADATKLDGFNASFFALDELHEAPNSKLYDVLTSSTGMREQPLSICITSAGFNRFSFCFQMRSTCIEILNNIKSDDTQASFIYSLDEDDDYQDEKNWIKSNPSLDVTVTSDYLKEQVTAAKNNSSLEVGILTKNFGIWCKTSDIWISNDDLLKSSTKLNLDFFKDKEVYAGVDLASVSDLTALSICMQLDDKFYFKSWYFLPSSALYDNANSEMYKLWKREGYLITTEGNVTDYSYITNILMNINETTYLQNVAYDKYNSIQWAIDCTEKGIPLEPYSQALWHFNQPTKEFERLIKSGRIVIDDNPITRYCFENVVLKYDHNENVKPIKAVHMNKIDGVISMLQALGTMIEQPSYNNELLEL